MAGLLWGIRDSTITLLSGLLYGLITVWNCGSAQAQVRTCPGLGNGRPGFNSVWRSHPQGQVQVVGRQRDQRYGVIVPSLLPSGAEQILTQIQACVPDAFLVESRWGSYVQAGFFYRRVEAETLSKALRSQRIDSRVIYYP